jgi:hypothetical protein
MSSPSDLSDGALPGLFQAADQASLHGQKRYLRATSIRLLLLVLAAGTAAATLQAGRSKVDVMSIVTAVVFAATLLVEVYLLADRPEQSWYDGRAIAESTKTLAWRYAVGGAPFPIADSGDEDQMGVHFRERLTALLRDAPGTSIEATTAPAISHEVGALRARPLAARIEAYLAGRIADQLQWYAGKAKLNDKRAQWWRIGLLVAELIGITAALLRAFSVVSFDLAGIVAAAVGAGAAWLAAKQYDTLARAYAFAANELALARSRLEAVQDPGVWAAEVANAEAAISREHTMWRASRTTVRG